MRREVIVHSGLCLVTGFSILLLASGFSAVASADTLTFPFFDDFDDCVIGPFWEQASLANPVVCTNGELTAEYDVPAPSAHIKAGLAPTNATAVRFGLRAKAEAIDQGTDAADYVVMYIGKGNFEDYYYVEYGIPTGAPETVYIRLFYKGTGPFLVATVPWDGEYHDVEAARDETGHWMITHDGTSVGETDEPTPALTEFDFVDLGMNNKGAYITTAWAGPMDSIPPILNPESSESILWPPNHQLWPITITANASDNSGAVMLTATVQSNEPQEDGGDGSTDQDWTTPVIDNEAGTIELSLRAERSGSEEGRVYTIMITATDPSGNASVATVEVCVPHDRRKK